VSAEGGAGALGKVSGKDDQGAWLNEAGSEEGGPVVVAVVGVQDSGAKDS
jgi:hypothetical protein